MRGVHVRSTTHGHYSCTVWNIAMSRERFKRAADDERRIVREA
jgi:hypothetical protein